MRQATPSLRLNWFANTQNGPAWPSNAWRTMSASKKSRLASCASEIWADPTLADIKRKEIVIDVRMVASQCLQDGILFVYTRQKYNLVCLHQAKVQPVLQDDKDGTGVGAQSR